MNRHLGCFALLLAALPLAGCSLTSDHFSCAMSTNGTLVRCVDYEQVGFEFRTTVEVLCRGLAGDFSTDTTCPQAGKVGGCKTEGHGYTQTAWYYPDSIAKTPSEVAGRCQGQDYFVDANGMRPADMGMSSLDMSSADR